MFLYQQLHRPLRDSQLADGVGRLGLADHQLTVDAVHLLADGDGHVLHVQVCPQQGEEFSPSQASSQFQIEDLRKRRTSQDFSALSPAKIPAAGAETALPSRKRATVI